MTRSNIDRFLRFLVHLEGILKDYLLAEPVAVRTGCNWLRNCGPSIWNVRNRQLVVRSKSVRFAVFLQLHGPDFRTLMRAEGGRKPPTSRDDSVVGVLGEVEGGGRLKATNESKRLVGGLFGQGWGRRELGSHQRVVMTRWWLFWARSSAEGARLATWSSTLPSCLLCSNWGQQGAIHSPFSSK